MSNAQDLLSILGGGAVRSGGRGASTSGSTEKSILSFKAGKMITELKPVSLAFCDVVRLAVFGFVNKSFGRALVFSVNGLICRKV